MLAQFLDDRSASWLNFALGRAAYAAEARIVVPSAVRQQNRAIFEMLYSPLQLDVSAPSNFLDNGRDEVAGASICQALQKLAARGEEADALFDFSCDDPRVVEAINSHARRIASADYRVTSIGFQKNEPLEVLSLDGLRGFNVLLLIGFLGSLSDACAHIAERRRSLILSRFADGMGGCIRFLCNQPPSTIEEFDKLGLLFSRSVPVRWPRGVDELKPGERWYAENSPGRDTPGRLTDERISEVLTDFQLLKPLAA